MDKDLLKKAFEAGADYGYTMYHGKSDYDSFEEWYKKLPPSSKDNQKEAETCDVCDDLGIAGCKKCRAKELTHDSEELGLYEEDEKTFEGHCYYEARGHERCLKFCDDNILCGLTKETSLTEELGLFNNDQNGYTVRRIFKKSPFNEIEIISENLIYSEIQNGSGCQVMNLDNNDLIHDKCRKIADLIREIEELNN